MFRFTIRDVLWLTVVFGLGIVWWIERTNAKQAKDEAKNARDAAIAHWDSTLTVELLDEYLKEYGRGRDDRQRLGVPPPMFVLPLPPTGFTWKLSADATELSVERAPATR